MNSSKTIYLQHFCPLGGVMTKINNLQFAKVTVFFLGVNFLKTA